MRKAWVVFALVLLLSLQLFALSLFHEVDVYGVPAYGTTELHIVKFDYVEAWVQVTVMSDEPGVSVSITLPNGTQVQTSSTYSFSLSLPRTGDFAGNAGVSLANSVSVDQSNPIAAWVDANSTAPPNFAFSPLGPNLDVTTITVVGFATVSLSGYGVAI